MTDEASVTLWHHDPERGFGQALFSRSGAPVDAVLERIEAGEPLEDVARDFGLSPEEVEYCRKATSDDAPRLAAAAEKARAAGRIDGSRRGGGEQAAAGTGVEGSSSADADLVARLRAWSPSTCWTCGEWGCTNAAGHDIYCMGDCDCETDCDCVCATSGSSFTP